MGETALEEGPMVSSESIKEEDVQVGSVISSESLEEDLKVISLVSLGCGEVVKETEPETEKSIDELSDSELTTTRNGRYRKRSSVSQTKTLTKKRQYRKRRPKTEIKDVMPKRPRGRPKKIREDAPFTNSKKPRVTRVIHRDRSDFVRRKGTCRRRLLSPDSKIDSPHYRKLPWTLAALVSHLSSNAVALKFCQEKTLLPRTKQCPVCKEEMLYSEKLSSDKGLGYVFRCSRRACQIVRSARSGTWFEKSKLPIRKSLLLTYCFASNFPFNLAVHESSFTAGCTSPTTVSDWYSYCREVCVDAMRRQMTGKIGGPMCIVEMDEAKVGDKSSKSFKGQLVIGFYCQLTQKVSLVCVPNNRCDASTIVPIIEDHILAGSTIVSNCWDPEEMLGPGYYHLVHNYGLTFVATEDGHRNSGIEKVWRHLKSSFPQAENYKKVYQLNEYLCEFLWRRWVNLCMLDPFEAFLNDASLLYLLPDNEI